MHVLMCALVLICYFGFTIEFCATFVLTFSFFLSNLLSCQPNCKNVNYNSVLYCLLKCITDIFFLILEQAHIMLMNNLYSSPLLFPLHRTGSQCWSIITGWMPLSQTWSWEIHITSGSSLRTNVDSATMPLLQRALPPSRRQVNLNV